MHSTPIRATDSQDLPLPSMTAQGNPLTDSPAARDKVMDKTASPVTSQGRATTNTFALTISLDNLNPPSVQNHHFSHSSSSSSSTFNSSSFLSSTSHSAPPSSISSSPPFLPLLLSTATASTTAAPNNFSDSSSTTAALSTPATCLSAACRRQRILRHQSSTPSLSTTSLSTSPNCYSNSNSSGSLSPMSTMSSSPCSSVVSSPRANGGANFLIGGPVLPHHHHHYHSSRCNSRTGTFPSTPTTTGCGHSPILNPFQWTSDLRQYIIADIGMQPSNSEMPALRSVHHLTRQRSYSKIGPACAGGMGGGETTALMIQQQQQQQQQQQLSLEEATEGENSFFFNRKVGNGTTTSLPSPLSPPSVGSRSKSIKSGSTVTTPSSEISTPTSIMPPPPVVGGGHYQLWNRLGSMTDLCTIPQDEVLPPMQVYDRRPLYAAWDDDDEDD